MRGSAAVSGRGGESGSSSSSSKKKEEKGELGLLVQALEGAEIVIEMRNESMIRGKLAHATPTMEYEHTYTIYTISYRRERERERDVYAHVCTYNYVCAMCSSMCIHVFSVYIEREVWSIEYVAFLEMYVCECVAHIHVVSRSLARSLVSSVCVYCRVVSTVFSSRMCPWKQ